jgi:hypothetical protein
VPQYCRFVGQLEVGTLTRTQTIQIGPASTGVNGRTSTFRPHSLALFQLISRDPFCDPLALPPLSSIAFTVPAAFSMLLKLRYKPDSNPTLSAITLASTWSYSQMQEKKRNSAKTKDSSK